MNEQQADARYLTEVEHLLLKLPTLFFLSKTTPSGKRTYLVYRRNMQGVITVRHSAKTLRDFFRKQLLQKQ